MVASPARQLLIPSRRIVGARYGWSIGRQRRYLLQLANGEPVDPAAFLSDREEWAVGDTFLAGGRRFRIREIADDNVAEVTAHMFNGIWTVEELPPG